MLFKKMKYQFLFLTFIFTVFSNSLFSQHQIHKKAIRFQELSVVHFRQGDTTNAFEFACEAIKKDSLYATPWVMLGNIYEARAKIGQAISAYSQALHLNPDEFPDLFFVVAKLEMKQKDFNIARDHVKKYLSLDRAKGKKKELALDLLQKINFRILAYNSPVGFRPENLGNEVNSVHDEYVNSLSTDENSMYITVKKNMGADIYGRINFAENIYQIDFNDSTWSVPDILEFNNELVHAIGGASISPNNRYLFFTSCNQNEGQGSCDLYYAAIDSGKLSSPQNLGPIVNSSSWDSQPSFSSDGKKLFFASKRSGGYGGSDIWISELNENGRFEKPFNAGEKINTVGDEMAPLIHYDAKSLYFSSNGLMGMGGFDLFQSTWLENNHWSVPKNLGYPINTENDEINLIIAPNGTTAYLSSDMKGGFGGYDIYKFELDEGLRPDPVTYIKGLVSDSETGGSLVAKVELGLLPEGRLFTRSESDVENGSFLLALPLNRSVALSVEKAGYLMYTAHFNTDVQGSKMSPVKMDIPLQKISLGATQVLSNIFFETNEYKLMEASFPELKKIVELMNDNPGIIVEISGHTDDIGSKEYNQQLSEKRAKSVVDFLIENNISRNRLRFKGYGFTKPIAENSSAANRAKNRRTEFKILNF